MQIHFWSIVLLLLAFFSPASIEADDKVTGTRGYIDEMRRPPPPYEGPSRSGKAVYEYRCQSCHARTTQGAPMPDDDIEWRIRYRQGVSTLMQHVIDGYKNGLMPARGGCRNCSEKELRAAVKYMLLQSGIDIDAK
jgi:cytochrome c5